MRIERIEAFPIKLPRDFKAATGTAGIPARLVGESAYRRAEHYKTAYSSWVETTLVRVTTDTGLTGWGEAQSPVAPEISGGIIDALIAPMLIGEDALAPEHLWDLMYAAMRVRGHSGGFYLDAIAGIDIAIWDICGKAFGQAVYRLLGGPCRADVPYYVSGLAGAGEEARLAYFQDSLARGNRSFKLFVDASPEECLSLVRSMRAQGPAETEIFVDALWRLDVPSAAQFAAALAEQRAGWLEAPLMPEDVEGHARLAAHSPMPIAIGESYRTRFELLPFFERRALHIVQPDLGRTGLSEARKIAALAEAFHVTVAPHVSTGLGPQIAAALHFAAACPNLRILECNPKVYDVANRFAERPLTMTAARLAPPEGPGLGIEVKLQELKPFVRKGNHLL